MPLYTVIGLAAENQMRYASTVDTATPEAAETLACAEVERSAQTTLVVAAVIPGVVTPVR